MNIEEIEYTPNPNAVKFIVDVQIIAAVGGVTKSFDAPEEAEGVPLARDIMAIEHVEGVFFASNYITVTQDGDADWRELMREIAEPIREATLEDTRGEGENLPENQQGEDGEIPGADDPRMEEIEEVLEREIMPYLEGDGGGLEIKGLVDDKLMIDYQGACGSCPASITGTLMSIENLLKKEVDEGLTVEALGSAPGTGGGMAGPGMPYGM
jgi:Fe-S cluster biogenesis protein NfuA